MSLPSILLLSAGLLAGLIAVLKVIAPLTKTKVDDEALVIAQEIEKVVDSAAPVAPAAPKA